jgi:hypothetical protein
MNKKIGICAAAVNLLSVIGFLVSMLVSSPYASYFTSIGIAFSFVAMVSVFAYYAEETAKAAGFAAAAFGGMYALCNSIVYFIQLTSVRSGKLTGQAAVLLDFSHFNMMFNLDMLGYCLMAVSTFFAGLTIQAKDLAEKWLKWLLIIHGVFAVTCFIVPLLGLFDTAVKGSDATGTFILVFWCVYFAPISALSIRFFLKRGNA